MTTPHAPTKYLGPNQYLGVVVVRNRPPTLADYLQPETGKYYPIGCVWSVGKNPTSGTEGDLYMLSKIVANQGYWTFLESGLTTVNSFVTNIAGPVVPTAGGIIDLNASVSTFTDGTVANTIKTEVQATNHALKVGRGTNLAMADLTVGVDHSILMGNTAADPGFTTTGTPYVTGISFNAGVNTLNTYTDGGSFTPVIAFGGSSTGITYVDQIGKYTRIGNIVYFGIIITLSSKGAQAGAATMSGFPVSAAGALAQVMPITEVDNVTYTGTAISSYINTSGTPGTVFTMWQTGPAGAVALSNTNFANNSRFETNGFYFIT